MVSLDALRKCEGKGGIIEKFAIAADSNKCLKPFILPITRAHLVHVYHIKCHALSKHEQNVLTKKIEFIELSIFFGDQ